MSFSTTDTGDKPADPYKEKNLEEPSLKDKVEDFTSFVDKCKVDTALQIAKGRLTFNSSAC